MKVAVIARLQVKASAILPFEAAFGRYQQTVLRSEPGVVYFGLHRSQGDPTCYTVLEQYRNAAALAEHRNTPHYQAIPATMGEFMAGPAEIEVLEAVE